MIMRRVAAALALVAGAGCAKKQPQAKPTPVTQAVQQADRLSAQVEAETGGRVASMTIRFIEPTEDDYVGLIVAAAGWARRTVARSIGVLQQTTDSPMWEHASRAATQRYALRPISLDDYQVVCGGNQPQQTSVSRSSPVCTMKYVDAVLQFTSVRLSSDSGYVGVGVTRVPSGATRSEVTWSCITLARKGAEWDARRSERMEDAHRCPRGIP
jgi:hypothetical protein